MPTARQILVLIGPPGAGKTTLARYIEQRTGAAYVEIQTYRDHHVSVADIAQDVYQRAAQRALVFECSGAAEDFEPLLEELAARGAACIVAGIFVSLPAALRRLEARQPPEVPKGHGTWSEHVQWTQTRLRLVPTDLDVFSESNDPALAAAQLADAWESLATRAQAADHAGLPPGASITFSQLRTRQICPLQYAYRHVWRTPRSAPMSPRLVIGQAVHLALAWLFDPGAQTRTLEELLEYFDRLTGHGASRVKDEGIRPAEENPGALDGQEQTVIWGRELLSQFFRHSYIYDARQTLAVEQPLTLELGADLRLTGRLDRLCRTASGELEVTEFKLRETPGDSPLRVPDMLQPAAYALAMMPGSPHRQAFARLYFLASDRTEQILISQVHATTLRMALRRWMRCLERRGTAARPGRHCQHCEYRRICPSAFATPEPAPVSEPDP